MPKKGLDMKRLCCLIVTLLCTTACGNVEFHERERLSDRIMIFDYDGLGADMNGHIMTPRQGAIGGFTSVGAGGCACN